jgi:tetratricopeptide (TPR) repeat protein
MWACFNIGLLSVRQGDLRRALSLLEQAMGICHEVDLLGWLSPIASALGTTYMLDGRVADALSLLTQAMEGHTATSANFQTLCHLSLGEALALAGRLEDSHVLAEGALAHARAHQARGHQAYALRLLGEIATRRTPAEPDQAKAHYHQALTLTEELGMRPLQAHCHLGLGQLYGQTGHGEQARAALSDAIELCRAMDMTFWLPQAEAALVQVT